MAIAPMMDWTDRHCRAFHRCLTGRTWLYTEMLTAPAVIHGPRARLLRFDESEHPVGLQLGGSDPNELAQAARLGAAQGYDEINLNCGCPSTRVQSGRFGACLMAEPDLVARLYREMSVAIDKPVTVKCRIGIDDQNPRDALWRFVETLAQAGCTTFVIHARKAWLQGLSPKQNRDVPPLDHALVHRLKESFPDFEIVINGGIVSLDEAQAHLAHVDGVMIGRAAYQDPGILGAADSRIFGIGAPVGPLDALGQYRIHMERELREGVALSTLVRPILGLFHGAPGARGFRRVLSTEGHRSGAGLDVLDSALRFVAPAMCRPSRAAAE